MRILLDASVLELPATGIAKATLGLYEAVLRLRPGLVVTAVHHGPLTDRLPSGMAEKSTRPVPGRWFRSLGLPLAARPLRPDVAHFPWNGKVPLLRSGAKVVTQIHDVLPLAVPGHFASEFEEAKYRRQIQRDIDRADLLMTSSAYSRDQIVRNFRVRAEPMVLPLATKFQPRRPDEDMAAACPGGYFIYVGGYDPRKGIEALLKIFMDLRRDGRIKSTLVLTGHRKYYSEPFRRLVEEAAAAGFVRELGYVSDERLAGLYSGALALVYPSRYEGFGLPPLEAMTCGCPVITTRCMSLPEVCGEAARYVNVEDAADFAGALKGIELDESLRRRFQTQGFAQAKKFSWDVAAGLFLDALDELMRAGK